MHNEEIDHELIERLKSRDRRFGDIDYAIKIEDELRNSEALKAVLAVVQEEADSVFELFIEADPTDVKLITTLQAKIRRARIIGNTLEAIRRKGAIAEQQLIDENELIGDNARGEQHG